jgi:hypothetical protein
LVLPALEDALGCSVAQWLDKSGALTHAAYSHAVPSVVTATAQELLNNNQRKSKGEIKAWNRVDRKLRSLRCLGSTAIGHRSFD